MVLRVAYFKAQHLSERTEEPLWETVEISAGFRSGYLLGATFCAA